MESPVCVSCPECGAPLEVPPERVGQVVACPDCHQIFRAAAPATPTGKASGGREAGKSSPPRPTSPQVPMLPLELDALDALPAPSPRPPAPAPHRRQRRSRRGPRRAPRCRAADGRGRAEGYSSSAWA